MIILIDHSLSLNQINQSSKHNIRLRKVDKAYSISAKTIDIKVSNLQV
jgi:hypothetical protein